MVADALSQKSRGVLANIATWEWKMLETVGQFGLQYNEQVMSLKTHLIFNPFF